MIPIILPCIVVGGLEGVSTIGMMGWNPIDKQEQGKMGRYIAETGKFKTLRSIDEFNQEIDVFVSHKSGDEAIAKRVARRISVD